MKTLLMAFYRLLGLLAMLAMVAAFITVGLGVVAREAGWDIQGLDGYAGYAIAAALFLALPTTFQRSEHIRVTLLMEKVSARWRHALQVWSLAAGTALAVYLAWFAVRLVWISFSTHDISPAMDATPLWIPQLAMALGAVGLAVALADALASHLLGLPFFATPADGEAARVE
ncbi:MAG TPA: TRAP transporter small permease subunit [Burkholderiaceae bacterium]|nr:TRAP transporter small permease subunit [Burkholderiaceae bacterium]HMY98588.1 TRAP transporter small permease subunit [Burkholderiaceae bacterium]HNB44307.1 TRAP transporter small permease subunit [Burkholderiaceae bacterium]HNG79713.1 TRAP transporter small permease subunit [Burkholderiaceae bacterium]